jgi:hypothetical protein
MADSNPVVSPYLHPLQMHKVREYVLFSITAIVIVRIPLRPIQTDVFLKGAAAPLVLFRSDIAYHFPPSCWAVSFHFQDC